MARLLGGTPSKYLSGLKTVVLTDAAGLNHEQRRAKTLSRGKKVPIRRCRGLYHHATRAEPAWIELSIDNIVLYYPFMMLRVPFFADMVSGEVFFHELGHHIHNTQAPEFREREDVAENWKKRLGKPYYRRTYWYWLPIAYLLYPLSWLIKKVRPSYEQD